ncbi:FMN-binding negative transcriptional regulator [Streptomyces armeniacus]|uniref:FMN-binding negative transcriptional regulator n=1 Tax=Streptomyces armeniacus TaxID=83291 RepID=A0A345XTP7_9ACTN|nr:FMN-binding negative transcriptional regulator [Streptomyces armeniacus]AXK35013.1 FMN-binding negative transcriptional regulator [Streptomyces armeniacus]
MLQQKIFEVTDPRQIRDLVRSHSWATLVSHTPARGLVVSHLPVLVEDGPGIALTGHLAAADAEFHELGAHDVVVVVQGPQGYISPTWYGNAPHVPTWNFVVVHVHGRPELLAPEPTYDVLSDTVDHFEQHFAEPWTLDRAGGYARRIASGVRGFRLPAGRVTAKAKLSQDEPAEVAERVADALTADQPWARPELAHAMRTVERRP